MSMLKIPKIDYKEAKRTRLDFSALAAANELISNAIDFFIRLFKLILLKKKSKPKRAGGPCRAVLFVYNGKETRMLGQCKTLRIPRIVM